MRAIISLLKDQTGATAAEYALILAVVGSAIALAAVALGNAIAGGMNIPANTISNL
jgi:pilus assembly protein Flp/PilA